MIPRFNTSYRLFLKDNTTVTGILIKNDLFTEMVWQTETRGIIFEYGVKKIIGKAKEESVLSTSILKKDI
jgi:hypothetical protein